MGSTCLEESGVAGAWGWEESTGATAAVFLLWSCLVVFDLALILSKNQNLKTVSTNKKELSLASLRYNMHCTGTVTMTSFCHSFRFVSHSAQRTRTVGQR